ncbi:hypothetical protein BJV82DRAFT_676082 [Fennellomyces sp. T-0311]|nr:hypothetical protein BJV82DRAFT_676082 [Fennellomyces sp. T-0311]
MLKNFLSGPKGTKSNDAASIPLDDLAAFEEGSMGEADVDEVMTEAPSESHSAPPNAVTKQSGDKQKVVKERKPHAKRGKYDTCSKEQVMMALRLLYVDKIECTKTAEQTKIKYKPLMGLINYYIKVRGYPPVPRSAPVKVAKARSARSNPEVDEFFQSYIKPQIE